MNPRRLLPLTTLLLFACSLERGEGEDTSVAASLADRIVPDALAAPDVGAVRVDDELLSQGRSLTDWPMAAFNYAQQRFSPLSALTPDTVRSLAIAWTVPLDTAAGEALAGPNATPIVAGDVLYATGAGGWVRAYDVRTGELLWRGDPEPLAEGAMRAATPPPGAALWKGRLFVARAGGRMVSYDAKTGRQLWDRQVGEAGDEITSAPLVARNLVYVGTSREGRGAAVAFDYNEGRERWRFWTAPSAGDPDGAASDAALAQISATWDDARPATLPGTGEATGGAPAPVRHTGALVTSLAFDPVGERLILGTGSAQSGAAVPDADPALAPARLFSRSLIAVGTRDGTFAWHRQLPGVSDASRPIMLARLGLATGSTPVAISVTRSGELATVALADGSLVGWMPSASGDPRTSGEGTPAEVLSAISYSPDAGLLFLPRSSPPPPMALRDREGSAPALQAKRVAAFALSAVDPLSGVERWTVRQNVAASGLLSTAGGLLFQGSAAGRLTAYSVANGRAVWSAPIGGAALTPPSSFRSAGTQHVALTVADAAGRARLVVLRGPAAAMQQTP